MRGDRPKVAPSRIASKSFTPHARGSTPLTLVDVGFGKVYPACAGIDLSYHRHLHRITSLPRMRGDRPQE